MEKLKLFYTENKKAVLIVAGLIAAYFIYTKTRK